MFIQSEALSRPVIDHGQSVTWLRAPSFGICAFSQSRSQTIIGVRTVLR